MEIREARGAVVGGIREALGIQDAVQNVVSARRSCTNHCRLQYNSRSTFFSFLGAGAGLSAGRISCLEATSDGPRSSTSSPLGAFTGLLVRNCRRSLVAKCILSVCLPPIVRPEPLTLLVPDALLLCGPLLAESSGITSEEDSGLSLPATREVGARSFAPVVVGGRRVFSAGLRALAEVDMLGLYPSKYVVLNAS